jgi:PhnB protein
MICAAPNPYRRNHNADTVSDHLQRSGRIMLADEYPDMGYISPRTLGGSAVSLHVVVDDADAAMARAVAGGGEEKFAVSDQFDGGRRGTMVDPFGHVWLIASVKEVISYYEMAGHFQRIMADGTDAQL